MSQYVAMEKFDKVCDATDVTNDYVEFVCPYVPTGMIAQVRTVTTGAPNVAGQLTTYLNGKIKVAVTAIQLGDVVSVLAFE